MQKNLLKCISQKQRYKTYKMARQPWTQNHKPMFQYMVCSAMLVFKFCCQIKWTWKQKTGPCNVLLLEEKEKIITDVKILLWT